MFEFENFLFKKIFTVLVCCNSCRKNKNRIKIKWNCKFMQQSLNFYLLFAWNKYVNKWSVNGIKFFWKNTAPKGLIMEWFVNSNGMIDVNFQYDWYEIFDCWLLISSVIRRCTLYIGGAINVVCSARKLCLLFFGQWKTKMPLNDRSKWIDSPR